MQGLGRVLSTGLCLADTSSSLNHLSSGGREWRINASCSSRQLTMAETVDFHRQPMRKTGIFLASASRRHCSAEQFKIFETSFSPIVGSNASLTISALPRAIGSGMNASCARWLVDMDTPVKSEQRFNLRRWLLSLLCKPTLRFGQCSEIDRDCTFTAACLADLTEIWSGVGLLTAQDGQRLF